MLPCGSRGYSSSANGASACTICTKQHARGVWRYTPGWSHQQLGTAASCRLLVSPSRGSPPLWRRPLSSHCRRGPVRSPAEGSSVRRRPASAPRFDMKIEALIPHILQAGLQVSNTALLCRLQLAAEMERMWTLHTAHLPKSFKAWCRRIGAWPEAGVGPHDCMDQAS